MADDTRTPAFIRLQKADRDLVDATLSVEYALAALPEGHPARPEWGRIVHAMVGWAHDIRDYLEEQDQ